MTNVDGNGRRTIVKNDRQTIDFIVEHRDYSNGANGCNTSVALVCALGASQILCIAGAARTPNYILEDLRSSMFVFLEVLVMSIRPDGSVPLMFGD